MGAAVMTSLLVNLVVCSVDFKVCSWTATVNMTVMLDCYCVITIVILAGVLWVKTLLTI